MHVIFKTCHPERSEGSKSFKLTNSWILRFAQNDGIENLNTTYGAAIGATTGFSDWFFTRMPASLASTVSTCSVATSTKVWSS